FQFPCATGIRARLEGQSGLVTEHNCATQDQTANFVARKGGQHVAVEISDAADARHAAASTAETSAIELPIRVPILHEVSEFEELRCLRGRVLVLDHEGCAIQLGTPCEQNLFADGCGAAGEIGDAFVDWRCKGDSAHLLAFDAVAELFHKMSRK